MSYLMKFENPTVAAFLADGEMLSEWSGHFHYVVAEVFKRSYPRVQFPLDDGAVGDVVNRDGEVDVETTDLTSFFPVSCFREVWLNASSVLFRGTELVFILQFQITDHSDGLFTVPFGRLVMDYEGRYEFHGINREVLVGQFSD